MSVKFWIDSKVIKWILINGQLYSYDITAVNSEGEGAASLEISETPRTITIADIISKIKTSSSKWIKTKGLTNFSWQDGYGIFSVSSSKVDVVENYMRNQSEHHKKLSFKDELRKFFDEYGIEFDERYVWD